MKTTTRPKGRDFPIFQPETSGPHIKSPLKMTAIIWDLDGCLVDSPCQSRFDWSLIKEVTQLMDGHPPNWRLISMANFFMNNQTEPQTLVNLLCTGRPEVFKSVTQTWLSRYKVKYNGLWMRKDGDLRPDAEVKLDMLKEILREYVIWFVVDDRTSVVKMWREQGLLCLQPQWGDY